MFEYKKALITVSVILSVVFFGCAQPKHSAYEAYSQFGNDNSFLSDNYQVDNMSIEVLVPTEKIVGDETLKEQKMSDRESLGHDSHYEPLYVVKRGDGTYTVLEGNETLYRLKKAGVKNVAVTVSYPYSKDVYSIDSLFKKNEEARSDFNAIVADIHRNVGGDLQSQLITPSYSKVKEKIKEHHGDPKRVTDLLLGRISFQNRADVIKALQYVNKRIELVAILDRWNLSTDFEDLEAVCYLRTPSGILGELSFSLAFMDEYKEYLSKLNVFLRHHKDHKYAAINSRLQNLKLAFRNFMANKHSARMKLVYTDLLSLANEMNSSSNILIIEGLVQQQEDVLNNIK